ncbi:MAG TPA: hypothetical protein DGJ56_07530 [Verrucomicrobiales bacterium]|nr:hypothetical protein [Verrucomicrobiales bacterium]
MIESVNRNFDFITRADFPAYLNRCGFNGKGAEVGVQHGEFSEYILTNWKGSTLFSIDAWQNFDEKSYIDIANGSNDEQILIYANTSVRLAPYGQRSIVWRMTSEQAALAMPDETLDFCYIDADHRYEAVKRDIEMWLPKVKPGGVICGHDYVIDGEIYNKSDGSLIGLFGVKKAVTEFAEQYGWKVHVTHEDDWPSWFAYK